MLEVGSHHHQHNPQTMDTADNGPHKPQSPLRMLVFWTPLCCSFSVYCSYVIQCLTSHVSAKDALAAVTLGILLGSVVVGFAATLGARGADGKRRVALGRWVPRICSTVSLVWLLADSAACCCYAERPLRDLYGEDFPWQIGVLVTCFVSAGLAMRETSTVVWWEQRLSVAVWVVFSFIYIGFAVDMHSVGYNPFRAEDPEGSSQSPAVIFYLSFVTTAHWAIMASDYYSNATSGFTTFAVTAVGVFVPSLLVSSLAILTVAMKNQEYAHQYIQGYLAEFWDHSFTGLLLRPLHYYSSVLAIIAILTQISSNIVCLHSAALTVHALLPSFTKIPRWLLVTISSLIICPLCLFDSDRDIESSCVAFPLALGYAVPIWATIIFEELFLFGARTRATGKLNPPPGLAAAFTFGCGLFGGTVAAGLKNMSQPDSSLDVVEGTAYLLWGSLGTTLVVYPVTRLIERWIMKR